MFIKGRLFPTPAPGDIPLSEICTVRPSFDKLLEAKASITITQLGFKSFTILEISSTDSIPVCPRTPGDKTETGLKFSSPNAFDTSPDMCLVAKILFVALGPSASGVISRLPRPITNTIPSFGIKLFISFDMIFIFLSEALK